MLGRKVRRLGLLLGMLAWTAGSGGALAAASNKIGSAALLTPTAVDTFYGAGTTSTNSTGEASRPNEVKELALALKGDPDLIYEHVRNNTRMVWTYGLSKGAMGVIVDRAGNAFDQAHLMVELLREGGLTASYKIGTITLTGTQFADWSGITSATAACQLLSSGGIPAVINGTTSSTCAYGAATVSSIQLGHAWVAVVIGGTTYVFDPAYKGNTFKTGMDLATGTGLTSGYVLSRATTLPGSGGTYQSGTMNGLPYINSVSAELMNSTLSSSATSLQTAIEGSSTASVGDQGDVVGGQAIVQAAIPVGGLRQTSLPYTSSVLRTISGGMPDQYRTSLQVQLTKVRPDTSTPTIINKTLYVDEIYGRRLTFEPNFDTTGASFTATLKVLNEFGAGPTVGTSPGYSDNPSYSRGTITLTVAMPYAADAAGTTTTNGSYMDTVVTRPVSFALPFLVLHSWGDAGRGLIAKWGARRDTPMPAAPGSCPECMSSYPGWKGDGRREQEAASWIAQSSMAARLNAEIAKSVYAQHYSVGIVSADTTVKTLSASSYWITNSYDRIDVETGYSLTSKSATATDRRAGLHAIAATIDMLKGAAAQQVTDLRHASSTASRFAWGNRPDATEDLAPNDPTRVFYRYLTTSDASLALAAAKTEMQTTTSDTGVHTGGEPTIGSTEVTARRTALSDAVTAYITAGFQVVASEEALLGPGQRGGGYETVTASTFSHQPSPQRGGALTAVRYNGSGDPIEIADVLVGQTFSYTGGGAGAQLYHQAQFDPSQPADVIKSSYIDLRPGQVTHASPATITTGVGGHPWSLTAGLTFRGGDAADETFGAVQHNRPQGPWTTNWNNTFTLSGSTLLAMGETDTRAMAGAVTALYALQDVYKASPSASRDVTAQLVLAWWLGQLNGNVATVSVGTGTIQLVRRADNSWLSPGPGPIYKLSGNGVTGRSHSSSYPSCYSSAISYMQSMGYDYGVSASYQYVVTLPDGSAQTFLPWVNNLSSNGICSRQQGVRLSTSVINGMTLTFSYAAQTPGATVEVLNQVQNTYGRKLVFTGGGLSGFNNGLTGGDLRTVTVSAPVGQPVTHTEPTTAVDKFETSLLGTGYAQRWVLDKAYLPTDLTTPAVNYLYDTLGRLKQTKDALASAGSRSPTQVLLANGLRAETVDALSNRTVLYADLNGRPVRAIDALGNVATSTYDGRGRLLSTTAPEGDQVTYEYDINNNQTKATRLAKPGSAEAGQTLVTQASYDQTINKPLWTKDARNNQTNYTYTGSFLETVDRPGTPGGLNTVYVQYNGGRPYQVTDYWGQQATATYNTDGSISSTARSGTYATLYTNDGIGQPTVLTQQVTGAAWNITYDANGRTTLVVEPNTGASSRVATRTTYDLAGRVTQVENGSYAGTTFTAIETATTTYDAVGNVIKVTTPAGVTQMSYDALNRVTCVAVRMNPAVYGSLPADACTASTAGTYGPDRISRNTYDAAGQVTQAEMGVGTALVQAYARYTYSANGLKLTLKDANDNLSTFAYDGFNRLKRLYYPQTTRGTGISSTTDYEEYGYDANGNKTSWRRRDGQTIQYTYNVLNQMAVKEYPNTTADDVYWAYDLGGRLTQITLGALGGYPRVAYGYDSYGRVSSETTSTTTTSTAVSSEYDGAGRRYRVGWGDNAWAKYTYDLANRLTKVQREIYDPNTAQTTFTTVADVTYGTLNRRSTVTRPNGVTTSYSYDTAGRLSGLTYTGPGPVTGSSQTFTYNPVSQTLTNVQATSSYVWSGHPTSTKNATHDGLNRDAAIAASAGYDARGNLIFDGTRTYTYDIENRLTSVTGGNSGLAITYDPLGRILKTTSAGTETIFTYDGQNLVKEVAADTATDRRYIHGLGVDEPLIWYEGGPTGTANWLLADRQGSIVATTPTSGVMTPITYGPYGEPQTWAGSRFRYTGQIALPEAQLYHYKARVYDPVFGRFLQTDPIGYDDGPNIYAYVKGDPVNASDPSGLETGTLPDGSFGDLNPSCSDPWWASYHRCVRLVGGGSRGGRDGGGEPQMGVRIPDPQEALAKVFKESGVCDANDSVDECYKKGNDKAEKLMEEQRELEDSKEGKCVHRGPNGNCIYREGPDGQIKLDSEYSKQACADFKAIQLSNSQIGALSGIPGGFAATNTVFGGQVPLLQWLTDVGATRFSAYVTGMVGSVTGLLGLGEGPPGCN